LLRRGGQSAGESVAKCQERTATVCDFGLQTVQQMQWLKEAFNWTERSGSSEGSVSKSSARN